MNKLFSKIAALSVGLTLAIGVGVAVGGNAAKGVKASNVSTLTFSAACGGSGTADDGVKWTVTSDASESTYDGTKGIHYGTGKKAVSYLNLSTSDISETITEIVVNASGASGTSAKLDVTVGGNAFGSQKSLTASAQNYTFSGSASGEILVAITQTSATKALYAKSIVVTYGSAPVTVYTITYDANGGTGTMNPTTSADPAVDACGFTAPSGQRFARWNTAKDGKGTDYAVGAKPGKDLDLYAIWEDIPTYTITYDANGGSETMDPTTSTDPAVAECAFKAPTGKYFLKWNTKNDGTGTDYAVGAKPGADLYLYAIWDDIPDGVVLNNIGADLGNTENTTLLTTDIDSFGTSYTLNYLQAKKQGNSMFLKKGVDAFVSNKTAMPSAIVSLTVTTNTDAAAATSYVTTFGTSEMTSIPATTGEAYVIGKNASYTYENNVKDATFFCISLGNNNNGQVLNIVATLEDDTKTTLSVMMNDTDKDEATVNFSVGNALFKAYDGDNVVVCSWTSSDTSVATVELNASNVAVVTFKKPGTTILTAENSDYNNGVFTLTIDGGALTSITVSGEMTNKEYTTKQNWSSDGLTATAVYAYGYSENVTSEVTWSYNPDKPAEGVTSVVATATYNNVSGSSAAQTVTVTVGHEGTAADPFTVKEALSKANEIGDVGNKGQGPWVTTGIISRVTSKPAATYWNANYYISDDGSTTNELQVYRGFYLNGEKFDAETAELLVPGKIVTVTGNLTGSYGCEYVANNYLLSIEDPSTGDIDVVFEPVSDLEIGNTGTFTASTTAANPSYSWEVDDSSVLSVNAETGVYTALKLGIAKVTVNVTSSDGTGFASAYVKVNGPISDVKTVKEANEIAAELPSGKTTDYYYYFGGYVSKFDSDGQTRALNITTLDEQDTIMVFVGKADYSSFIEGINLGDYLVVKSYVQNYSGTFELTSPVKISCAYSAVTLARELLDATDTICEDYDGKTSNKEAIASVWGTLSGDDKYGSLSEQELQNLAGAARKENGTKLEQAMARYDYLTGKYELDNFINGRTPVAFAYNGLALNVEETDNSMIIIVSIAATTAVAFAALLIIKKKKHN